MVLHQHDFSYSLLPYSRRSANCRLGGKFFVTLCAVKWFFTNMNSLVLFQFIKQRNSLITLLAPERFCTMSSFMFLQIMRKWEFLDTLWTAKWLLSRTMRFCIGERGKGCCYSFKNVTQPLMFKCQTWIEKCQKSLDFTYTKSFDFTLKITKISQKLRNFPKIAYFFKKKIVSYNQFLL